jgi:hypothetical protein
MSGEAASYYNADQVFQHPRPAPPPAGPPPQQDNKYGYQQGPPQNEKYRPVKDATNGGQGGYDFNQAFKIEKPKYNDIWAGLLVGYPSAVTNASQPANPKRRAAHRRLPGLCCHLWLDDPQICH